VARAVIYPDDQTAIGDGDDVEIAIAIDIGCDDVPERNVVSAGDGTLEGRNVKRSADADLGIHGQRRSVG
jgi:hypothetical protein